LAAHIDILPTLAEIAGLKRPRNKPDGRSLLPLLRGEPGDANRALVVQVSQRLDRPRKWANSAVLSGHWRLINGAALYDLRADPGQQKDVAADHPDQAAKLREEYERWWADVSARFDEYTPFLAGSEHENPTCLTCHDWHSDQNPYNQEMVRQRMVANGFWPVEFEKGGSYEFTLCEQPLANRFPLRAVRARLRIGASESSRDIEPGAAAVTFRMDLRPGNAVMQTWLEETGGVSRGAYFVYIRRLPA
jgi:hypothetical protein